ncbi:hypothetical protein Ancab_020546 [Ancistrocladus abbreviatus]
MSQFAAAVICTIILLGCEGSSMSAKVYIVGDPSEGYGWRPGFNYKAWIKGKTFFKGDILMFQYGEGYSVNEVTAEGFKACNGTNALHSGYDGNTSTPLKIARKHYFICAAFEECSEGMNLTVTVHRQLILKN